MIWYNGIELDYRDGTLKKVSINKALSDIESLLDKKGTKSTTFAVPRTAWNEKALGYVTSSGLVGVNTTAECYFKIDGNIKFKGIAYVVGYDNKEISLQFFGSDISLINELQHKPMKDLITDIDGNYIQYTDAYFIQAIENRQSSASGIHFKLTNPALYSSPTVMHHWTVQELAPAFYVDTLIKKILGNYNIVSDFLNSEYCKNQTYSNYVGKQFACNYTVGYTNILTPADNAGDLDLGAMNPNYGGAVLKFTKYAFNRDFEECNITGSITLLEDIEDIEVRIIFEGLGTEYDSVSIWTPLKQGVNNISFNITGTFGGWAYAALEYRNNTNDVTLIASPFNFSIDSVLENNYSALQDYLGEKTQFEFLSEWLKHFNLVMDIDDKNNVYIDCQDNISSTKFNFNSNIITNQLDISNIIDSVQDVTFEYEEKSTIVFQQNLDDNNRFLEKYQRTIIENYKYGNYVYNVNSFQSDTDNYETFFNMPIDYEDTHIISNSAAEPLPMEDWENVLGLEFRTFVPISGSPYTGYNGVFPKSFKGITNTTYSVNALVDSHYFLRWQTVVPIMFINTLEQMKNNKSLEVRLQDISGDLINFRTDYIISGQVYKLLEYDYDLVSKEVIAKLIIR